MDSVALITKCHPSETDKRTSFVHHLLQGLVIFSSSRILHLTSIKIDVMDESGNMFAFNYSGDWERYERAGTLALQEQVQVLQWKQNHKKGLNFYRVGIRQHKSMCEISTKAT
mmetsp:Transcript_25519/g.39175  ORF Transcript_25519/g.39175 Transcript_25519/m.39175 type:complete len:113 (-) Transcript_25519:180-518(-)